jgi:hypothetical protein
VIVALKDLHAVAEKRQITARRRNIPMLLMINAQLQGEENKKKRPIFD